MELTRFREFSPDVYREYPLEEWSNSLRSVCGNFQPKPCDGVRVDLVKLAKRQNGSPICFSS